MKIPNQNLSFTNESLNRSINSPLRPRAARILVIFRSKTSREPPFPSARDGKGSSRDGARLALGNVANLCYTASRVIFPSDAIHFRAKRKVWRNLQQPDSPESSRESVWVALLLHSGISIPASPPTGSPEAESHFSMRAQRHDAFDALLRAHLLVGFGF